MLNSHWAVVHEGRIELTEPAKLPDGAVVLVTVVQAGDDAMWQEASLGPLREIWDNPDDDLYAQLLSQ